MKRSTTIHPFFVFMSVRANDSSYDTLSLFLRYLRLFYSSFAKANHTVNVLPKPVRNHTGKKMMDGVSHHIHMPVASQFELRVWLCSRRPQWKRRMVIFLQHAGAACAHLSFMYFCLSCRPLFLSRQDVVSSGSLVTTYDMIGGLGDMRDEIMDIVRHVTATDSKSVVGERFSFAKISTKARSRAYHISTRLALSHIT